MASNVDDALLTHLSLPPQLPQRQDRDIDKIEAGLIDRLTDAAKLMRDLPGNCNSDLWERVRCSVESCKGITANYRLEKASLIMALQSVSQLGFLPVYIRNQNAALFIYFSQQDDEVVFEVFETSPRTEDVLAAETALQWDFPGSAVAIPSSVFCNQSFIINLASFIEQASLEQTKAYAAQSVKAGSFVVETRNTADPSLISSMLIALLEGNGRRVSPSILRKRVRDDVCWNNADQPWRRLPLWLVMRVIIHRYLSLQLGGDFGHVEYKFFVCAVLAQLLEDVTTPTANPDRLGHLRTKLCRRLVKIDADQGNAPLPVVSRYRYLFSSLSAKFDSATSLATSKIVNSCEAFKTRHRRVIYPIPRRADASSELRLSLELSGSYLKSVVEKFKTEKAYRSATARSPQVPKSALGQFPETYFKLAATEDSLKRLCENTRPVVTGNMEMMENTCIELADHISNYIADIGSRYDGNIEQKGVMLLTVMELWTRLDQIACTLYPLLLEFHPWFWPEMIDVLHLPRYQDMMRLQKIQNHLRKRVDEAKSCLTIFAEPSKECFANRYYEESPSREEFASLQAYIESIAGKTAERKREEWTEKSEQYESLSKKIDESACVFLADEFSHLGSSWHDPHCPRCRMKTQASRLRIEIFENPLPSDPLMTRVVIFELFGLEAFQAYRDVTWAISSSLACPKSERAEPPRVTVREYSELKTFARGSSPSLLLASTVKSFLVTHYKSVSFPVEWDRVCRPNALKYRYFDQESSMWPSRQRNKPTFSHQCAVEIPETSPLYSLVRSLQGKAPTSYGIIASQGSCPVGVNVHEYMAFQSLLAGANRKWISVIAELGSANLNFSTEATMCLVSYLALQCGPAAHNQNPHRASHLIFEDEPFCEQLYEQLSQRLDILESNWREVYLMDIVITLSYRLYSLRYSAESGIDASRAASLLDRARRIVFRWTKLLQGELQKASDSELIKRVQFYALWAALLCKRTFAVYLDQTSAQQPENIDAELMHIFIECCIITHQSLADGGQAMPATLRNTVVRDFKMMFDLRGLIKQSILRHPETLMKAIEIVWPAPSQDSRQLSDVQSSGRSNWIELLVTTDDLHSVAQMVQYNCLHGVVLIDGMPIGRLPPEHQNHLMLKDLLGQQSFLTAPSSLRGMQYVLNIVQNDHQIHVGFQNNTAIIRAYHAGQILQLVNKEVFGSPAKFDIPCSLVYGNFHWLNLRTGRLEIRPADRRWKPSKANWTINIYDGKCSRIRAGIEDLLVDPHQRLFHRVCRVFEGFEPRDHITVYQPFRYHAGINRSSLTIELKRLQLTFGVNRNKQLHCHQLAAVIDYNQDAGTWYGLKSMLVLRSDYGPHRTILVPLGDLEVEKKLEDHYVSLRINSSGLFGKFQINDALGRIDCAAEPALIYRKAELHAYTSLVTPDSLTGRTGTEEALHWLSSATCQPWTPLSPAHTSYLKSILKLTPERVYYPEDMRCLKKETWDDSMTTTIQHDAYSILVTKIITKSNLLDQFSHSPREPWPLPNRANCHLHRRAWLRRNLMERESPYPPESPSGIEGKYLSRAHNSSSKDEKYRNVLEAVSLIRTWPGKLRTEENLAQLLEHCPNISGYVEVFDKVLLTDRLNVDLRAEWGRLICFSRAKHDDPFSLMFMFAPMAFKYNPDMSLIRTAIAFAIFHELRDLGLPQHPDYVRFKLDQIPTKDSLLLMMKPYHLQPPPDDREVIHEYMSAKEHRKLQEQKHRYDAKVEEDCKFLAEHLLLQWPCRSPDTRRFPRDLLVDIDSAMNAIRPEWERLFHNTGFGKHLNAVQEILRRRQCEDLFKSPDFIPSADLLPQRLRGKEIPLLQQDLMLLPGPLPQDDAQLVLRSLQYRHSLMGRVHMSQIPAFMPLGYWKSLPVCKLEFNTADGSGSYLMGALGTAKQWAEKAEHAPPCKPLAVAVEEMAVEGTISELDFIISQLKASKSHVRQRYGQELALSLQSFRGLGRTEQEYFQRLEPTSLDAGPLEREVCHQIERIRVALEQPHTERSQNAITWLQKGCLWPAITPVTVLEPLRSTASCSFGSNMKESIIQYGMAITNLQREMRLNTFSERQDRGRYKEEEMNCGHKNWKPCEYPDWLLLEIESNLLIRPDQVNVALATISPASHSNSVLQMNMGQGKTSCIIPMAALVLANGRNLARVSIPKALLQQTAQLLHSRLGGLLNRELAHVPFSRRTNTSETKLRAYLRTHQKVLSGCGVMLCLPEHSLSFMLSGQQRVLDDRVPEATTMINIQSWLNRVCRDIMDESDYTLAVRTQLIYPSGSQMSVDGHPHRWIVVEQLLGLVDSELDGLSMSFPHSIEVVRRPGGGYPLLYFLRTDAEEELIRRLTASICNGLSGILPVGSLDQSDRIAVKDFISNPKVRPSSLERVKTMYPDQVQFRKTVYLLRGLLVNRILMMCLKKRWNVQYGLHPGRDPIAVPFHAKGVPSEQSEWGHPDVAILLSCLAFYYDGVTMKQLRQALEHLLKSDDPSCEYDRWTQNALNFPGYLQDWNAINIDDEAQALQLWVSLRYNMVVIDYFLNNFVFPQHAKQFRVKLQSNGWDLPLFPPLPASAAGQKGTAKVQRALTSGFSGTNDNRSMLPLTIKQQDLPGLSHTNAEVLTYLLQNRNRGYVVMANSYGKRLSEEEFLCLLENRGIRVLIDAGASILEMDNVTLVKKWLEIDSRAPAALYFDQSNKPLIINRAGRSTPLVASTFADDLYECLVYIDEAHTRGTDLKLPAQVRGALTLGLGQTKDHTVQAAMRLRQLATTQSVVFFAPPEVHQSILDLQEKTFSSLVDSSDIISWLLVNTCDGIEQLHPLFYSQGMDFCNRMNAAATYPDFLKDRSQREAYIAAIRQEEQQTLRQLYAPKIKNRTEALKSAVDPRITTFIKELGTRKRAFQDTGRAVHGSALQEVEQEREVAFEVESVRQVKKPVRYEFHKFPGLNKDLETFARTGRLPADSYAYSHFLRFMARTGLGSKFGVAGPNPLSKLFISAEFGKTVKSTVTATNDNFLRPVNWVLWSDTTETAIAVIPEEAEALIPILREPNGAKTYLMAYAAPTTRKMLHFNRLDYYAVPALPKDWKAPNWLAAELGLFAGKLYFDWDEYDTIRKVLGIDEEAEALTDVADKVNGFQLDGPASEDLIEIGASETGSGSSLSSSLGFTSKPLLFLQEWLAVRRRGQDFAPTPMGFITQGKALTCEHSFFQRDKANRSAQFGKKRPMQGPTQAPMTQDEQDMLEDDLQPHEEYLSDDASDDAIEYESDEMYTSGEDEEGVCSSQPRHGPPRRGHGNGPRGRRGRGRYH